MSAQLAARRRWRLAAWWAVGVLMLLVAVLLAGRPDSGAPLDPASAGPRGLLGTVRLLEELGVDVEVGLDPPTSRDTRVFVPVDLLGTERRSALLEWVQAGGTLVVAGTEARLHGLAPAGRHLVDQLGATGRTPDCPVAALEVVEEVVHAAWDALRIPEAGVGCFGDGEIAWLIVRAEGEGTIVALGSAEPFTNAALDRADNAVLAAALLAPAPGDRVLIVPRPPVGEGDASLAELVPRRVGSALILVVIAAALAVLWRARRLGPPVVEALPPVVPSAELARSVGGLLHRAGSRQGAANRLRAGCRATVARSLGIAGADGSSATSTVPRPEQEALSEQAAHRLDVSAALARTALVDAAVADDASLMEVARAARQLRRAAHRGVAAVDDHRGGRPPPTSREHGTRSDDGG